MASTPTFNPYFLTFCNPWICPNKLKILGLSFTQSSGLWVRYNLSTPVEIARVRNEFYQRQEELQEKVNGNNSVLRLSNKDYNE